MRLRWQDVDFTHNRVLIHSVKTEHHERKKKRYIPLFDELREVLLNASARGAGVQKEDFVIQNRNYRQPGANLRTQFDRIALKAGVRVWRKAWQNMRATRETELIERTDLKDVCKIIGNSEIVALQHPQDDPSAFSRIGHRSRSEKSRQNRG